MELELSEVRIRRHTRRQFESPKLEELTVGIPVVPLVDDGSTGDTSWTCLSGKIGVETSWREKKCSTYYLHTTGKKVPFSDFVRPRVN